MNLGSQQNAKAVKGSFEALPIKRNRMRGYRYQLAHIAANSKCATSYRMKTTYLDAPIEVALQVSVKSSYLLVIWKVLVRALPAANNAAAPQKSPAGGNATAKQAKRKAASQAISASHLFAHGCNLG